MNKFIKVLLVPFLSSSLLLQGCVPIVAGAGVAAAGGNAAASNLSIGNQIDDTGIKIKANSVLNNYPKLEYQSNVEIAVFDGVVLILGQVPTQELKTDLAKKISAINGVKVVYNQLQVAPSISFSRYAEDSWITARVSAKFIGNVNPSHFKVITENAIVYIMGVTTQAEGNKAAELASQVPGVTQVVKAYTYVQSDQATIVNANN